MKLVLTGGFLGSGKTTAIVRACRQLMAQGMRVAVITNDQGNEQVDAAFVRSEGIAVEEVSNGCFCCRYNDLDLHLTSLIETHRPDFIFAESVGSCTDVVATVAKPLCTLRADINLVVCVFADAELLASVIAGKSTFFDEPVRYIYKKQLEEADLITVSKTDLVSDEQLASIDTLLQTEYPEKRIFYVNAFQDENVCEWTEQLKQFEQKGSRSSLEVDYVLYGDGEARMAWLDRTVDIHCSSGNGGFVVREIIRSIFNLIRDGSFAIGHLKFWIETPSWQEKISFTAVSTSGDIRIKDGNLQHVQLLINARIQCTPQEIKQIVDSVLHKVETSSSCVIATVREASFSPGFPKPTHRM